MSLWRHLEQTVTLNELGQDDGCAQSRTVLSYGLAPSTRFPLPPVRPSRIQASSPLTTPCTIPIGRRKLARINSTIRKTSHSTPKAGCMWIGAHRQPLLWQWGGADARRKFYERRRPRVTLSSGLNPPMHTHLHSTARLIQNQSISLRVTNGSDRYSCQLAAAQNTEQ